MNLENMSMEELMSLRDEIRKRIIYLKKSGAMERLKKSEIIKKYSYILDTDAQEDYEVDVVIGLNAYNNIGFVDDHFPEEAMKDIEDLIDMTGLCEIMSCTYDLTHKEWETVKPIFHELGIFEMKARW